MFTAATNHTWGRKILSALLTIALLVSVLPAIAPATVSAANGNAVIDLTGFDFGADVTGYTNWLYDASQRQFTITGDVTVTGFASGATDMLTIDIASGKKVTWEAAYEGAVYSRLLRLTGAGAFEVVSGGSITQKITSVRDSYAIEAEIGDVTISGGTVSAAGDESNAIYANDDVTISGGTVSVAGDGSNAVRAGGNVAVSGGTVSGYFCIDAHGDINITGGVISTAGNFVLVSIHKITVSGGFVFGYGTSILEVDNAYFLIYTNWLSDLTINGTGVVVAWDKAKGTTAYIAGTSTDLVVGPSGATAVWNNVGGKSGVSYTNGNNNGFFAVSGVTVQAASTPGNPSTPTPSPTPSEEPSPTVTPTPTPTSTVTPTPTPTSTPAPVVVKYKVTLNANGGKFSGGKTARVLSVVKGKKVGTLTKPVRKGYQFMGYYTKKVGGAKVTSSLVIKKNVALYAHWTRTGVVNTKYANLHLRDKSGIPSKILAKYAKGTKVVILGTDGNWYKVQIGNKVGWMYKKYVKLASVK